MSKLIQFLAIGIVIFVGYKYYDFSQTDEWLNESCQFGTYSQFRKILNIDSSNTKIFCSCMGVRFKKNLGFLNSISKSKKMFEDTMIKSAYECRRSLQ